MAFRTAVNDAGFIKCSSFWDENHNRLVYLRTTFQCLSLSSVMPFRPPLVMQVFLQITKKQFHKAIKINAAETICMNKHLIIITVLSKYFHIIPQWYTCMAFIIQNTQNISSHAINCLTAICPGLPGWADTRKVKPIWILLKQETVSGSGISWAILKSAPRSRQITTPAPHPSVFYRLDALPATQPTASKHRRQR